jgi:Tol biopolymer transport system component
MTAIFRFVLAAALLGTGTTGPSPDATARFRQDVVTLAADDMEGRGLGTAGLGRAADHLERRLRALGLRPAFAGGYRQPFQVKTGVALVPGGTLEAAGAALPTDAWTPLGFSSAGAFEGELVFVGYGVEAPPVGYQELSGVDLRGKVAFMLRYEPQEKDEHSPFDGRRPSRWSGMRYKVHQARERGAVAVVFATGPLQDEGKDLLPALANDGPESPAGIPVVQVRRSVAERWLAEQGIDLRRFQETVDRDLAPQSRATSLRLRGRVALAATYAQAENLAGVLPGRGRLADEVVVVGAHYDHLGLGGDRSLRPNDRAVHNGADDNASGVAGALLAVEELKARLAGAREHRTVVCALFSAEEVGLAGSAHFVSHPPFPVARVVGMINLDMIGRLREDKVVAFGAESAAEWADILAKAAAGRGLQMTARGDGYGPSDQTSFYAAKVPVLHFFTGTHEAYHTPDDDAGAINAEGGAQVALLTADVAERIAREVRPVYARSAAPPALQGDSRGYGAYLGTVPDYRAMEETTGGVLLADVRAGGPAERAGIRGGDRLVELAGTKLANLYDMTFALQDHRPGETVDVVVLRGGERLTLRATLGERRASDSPPAVASPSASPGAPPAAPAHVPAASPSPSAGLVDAAFYAGRPGPGFAIAAGQPFARRFEGERHLADVRQLTFGGENAEAYFSPDGRRLVYQSTPPEGGCDQQYILDLATGDSRRVSSGKGRTTCGYFDWPEADRVIYASTEAAGDACPRAPDRSRGYVWPVYADYDLWETDLVGRSRRLTDTPGYDAEATWCHRGGRVVFTSTRDGDLDLYEMDEAGQVRRLTSAPGYDGGAFYSPDCTQIVWRASRPEGADLEEYRRLLSEGLVRPTRLELFVMNADGSGARAITGNGAANFCPYFHPDGKRVIYASNVGSASGREFDLWMVGLSGGEPERLTTAPGFDGFPIFTPDGQWLVWGSNRANPEGRDTNLFIARWVP